MVAINANNKQSTNKLQNNIKTKQFTAT